MKLVVGLGNPGKEYENTRHNVGFMILDSFVEGFLLENKFQAFVKQEKVGSETVLFVKPVTYMNLSGNALQKIVQYYHVDKKDILILQDDLDLSFGHFKMKENSSSGGHNGIKSIIQCLGTQEFCRLKVGIGHNQNLETVDYVLQKFSKEEMKFFESSFGLFQDIIRCWILEGAQGTMARYNGR